MKIIVLILICDVIILFNRVNEKYEKGGKSMSEKRQQWSTATDSELYQKFVELSKEKRIAKTLLLDEAIADLLVKYKKLDKNSDKVIKL